MDNIEAREILTGRLNELRELPYNRLLKYLDHIETPQITGKSGKKYFLEIHADWDDHPKGTIRVSVAIDDGGWRALIPMTEDFLITPAETAKQEIRRPVKTKRTV